jgi:hypothetical protein
LQQQCCQVLSKSWVQIAACRYLPLMAFLTRSKVLLRLFVVFPRGCMSMQGRDVEMEVTGGSAAGRARQGASSAQGYE